MNVVTVLVCQHCGAHLPPDAAPCDGSGIERGAAYIVEEIEWRGVKTNAPKICVERHRNATGKVVWPSAFPPLSEQTGET
jgi:hypothetical protein